MHHHRVADKHTTHLMNEAVFYLARLCATHFIIFHSYIKQIRVDIPSDFPYSATIRAVTQLPKYIETDEEFLDYRPTTLSQCDSMKAVGQDKLKINYLTYNAHFQTSRSKSEHSTHSLCSVTFFKEIKTHN